MKRKCSNCKNFEEKEKTFICTNCCKKSNKSFKRIEFSIPGGNTLNIMLPENNKICEYCMFAFLEKGDISYI